MPRSISVLEDLFMNTYSLLAYVVCRHLFCYCLAGRGMLVRFVIFACFSFKTPTNEIKYINIHLKYMTLSQACHGFPVFALQTSQCTFLVLPLIAFIWSKITDEGSIPEMSVMSYQILISDQVYLSK